MNTQLSKHAFKFALLLFAVVAAYFWYAFYFAGFYISKTYFSDSVSSVFSIQNSDFTLLNSAQASVLTFILIILLFLNKRLRNFIIDAGDEISRVSFPRLKETQRKSLMVLALVAVSSMVLFFFDLIFVKLINFILDTAT